MATTSTMPIHPPILRGEDAKYFMERVREGLGKPLYPKPTPKIEQAKALAYELFGKK